jgi:ATP-dependent Clp protease protease subunit
MARFTKDGAGVFLDNDLDIQGRVIYLGQDIDEDAAELVIKGLHILSASRKEEPVTILLNSGGGDVTQGLAIFDAIRLCESTVRIRVMGEACSMAAIILQAGDVREATVNSRIMIHQGTIQPPEEHSKNVKSWLKLMDQDDKLCDSILLARIQEKVPKYSYTKLRRQTEFDTWLTAQQAQAWGLIDEVIE